MKYTKNYNFKKPEPYDTRNINDINDSFDLVDAKLKETQDKNTNLDETFKQLIIDKGNNNAEIVAARRDKVNNKTYNSVPDRLDDFSGKLAQKANEVTLAVERERINQILANPGSTSGDLALNDMKVAFDGTTYNSPGDASRGQANILNNEAIYQRNMLFKSYNAVCLNDVARTYANSAVDKITGKIITGIRTVIDFPVTENTDYILLNPYPDKDYLWYLDSARNPISKHATNIINGANNITSVANCAFIRFVIIPGYDVKLYLSSLYGYKDTNIKFIMHKSALVNDGVLHAENFGVSPSNTSDGNSLIMQRLLDIGGTISLMAPGNYKFKQILKIGSNTELYFGKGVVIDLVESESGFIANKAAFSFPNFDSNIKIDGLMIKCNGNESGGAGIVGMRGKLNFLSVNNLVVTNIRCSDLGSDAFFIHLCRHYNTLIDTIRVEGSKDAIHVNYGRNLTIRKGYFKTYDDPIALNAHDYPNCVPMFGNIEEVLIEDCVDEADVSTTGFFCRMLGGAWLDWTSGNSYRHSDIVRASNGSIYRMIRFDNTASISATNEPTHASGDVATSDGITWRYIQTDGLYNIGCKNITFKDIILRKNRENAFAFQYDNDNFSRSYYPNAVPYIQSNITFDNIKCIGTITNLIYGITPCDNLSVKNSVLNRKTFLLLNLLNLPDVYMGVNVFLTNNYYNDSTPDNQNIISTTRNVKARLSGNISKKPLTKSASVTVLTTDIL